MAKEQIKPTNWRELDTASFTGDLAKEHANWRAAMDKANAAKDKMEKHLKAAISEHVSDDETAVFAYRWGKVSFGTIPKEAASPKGSKGKLKL